MIIREASEEDTGGMVLLLKALFSIEEDFTFDETLQQKGLKLMLESPLQRRVVVAEEHGEIVGMASVQVLISTSEGAPVGLVEDVVVAEGHRKKGIGRRLLAGIESWAMDNGLKRLQLLADSENTPALEWYKKIEWNSTRLICLRKKI